MRPYVGLIKQGLMAISPDLRADAIRPYVGLIKQGLMAISPYSRASIIILFERTQCALMLHSFCTFEH